MHLSVLPCTRLIFISVLVTAAAWISEDHGVLYRGGGRKGGSSDVFPSWKGITPSPSINASAGLRPIPNTVHATVFNATDKSGQPSTFGTYNHGPIITFFEKTFFLSWYNAPVGEDQYKRGVYATSRDGIEWSQPAVLFPSLTEAGQENGPWTILGSPETGLRLYAQSGSQDAGLHIEGIATLMRRVGANPAENGPIFWLNRTAPQQFQHLFPTYLDMDNTTRQDAEQVLASLVRTTVAAPDATSDALATHPQRQEMSKPVAPTSMAYNERSLYMVPGTRTLVLLLRVERGPTRLFASTCELPGEPLAQDETTFSCRPGAGDSFMNLVEVVKEFDDSSVPRTCNWTVPAVTTIPDSHSRTCTARFNYNTNTPTSQSQSQSQTQAVYLVGNQMNATRDPLTLAVARDGVVFDLHWAVRYGAPPVLYPGNGKGVGFQYPAAMTANNTMWVTYSVGKEDIVVSRFDLSDLNL